MNQDRFVIEHRAHESRYALLDRGESLDESGAEPIVIGEESYLDVDAPVGSGTGLLHE